MEIFSLILDSMQMGGLFCMANKNVVLMLLFGLTVNFTGCADSAPSSIGTDSAANGTFEAERTPVRESRSWGEFDIQLSYNIIPNEADTSNTHISDITVSITDKEGIISECNVINPALSAAPGNSYFPSDLSIELELMDFSDWSVAAVKAPARIKDGEPMYYTSFFFCSDNVIQTVYPDDREGGFFPVLSAQTEFETDKETNSFMFSDKDGEKYCFTVDRSDPEHITLKAI